MHEVENFMGDGIILKGWWLHTGGGSIYIYIHESKSSRSTLLSYRYFMTSCFYFPFPGYDDTVNTANANSFTTAAFRFGHSQIHEMIRFAAQSFSKNADKEVELSTVWTIILFISWSTEIVFVRKWMFARYKLSLIVVAIVSTRG